jgi:hypothetical protein
MWLCVFAPGLYLIKSRSGSALHRDCLRGKTLAYRLVIWETIYLKYLGLETDKRQISLFFSLISARVLYLVLPQFKGAQSQMGIGNAAGHSLSGNG